MNRDLEIVVARCKTQRVTGVLRVRNAGEEAEIRFLSGIHDSIRCGSSEGDEAYERIASWPSPAFQAIESLPPFSESSQQAFPQRGALSDCLRPVNLMRYCEGRCLTCTLTLRCAGREVQAAYELGELKSIEPDADMTISVLEATEGTYRFELPAFELPELAAPRAADPALLGGAASVTEPIAHASTPPETSQHVALPYEEPVPLSTDALEASLTRSRRALISPTARHNLAVTAIGLLCAAALLWLVLAATQL